MKFSAGIIDGRLAECCSSSWTSRKPGIDSISLCAVSALWLRTLGKGSPMHRTAGVAALMLTSVPLVAQHPGLPILAPTPAGLPMPPGMVVEKYLSHRLNITGTLPDLIFCGEQAVQIMTSDFREYLVKDRRRAASIEVNDSCPDAGSDLGKWLPPSDRSKAHLVIVSMSFGPLSSRIEAISSHHSPRPGVYLYPHREIFEWDHRRDMVGTSLEFLDFDIVRDRE